MQPAPVKSPISKEEAIRQLENKRLRTLQSQQQVNISYPSKSGMITFTSLTEKVAYFNSHPEEFEKLAVADGQKNPIPQDYYAKLPQEKKSYVDSNPDKFIVINQSTKKPY